MKNQNQNTYNAIISTLSEFNARGGVKENAATWAQKLKSFAIEGNVITFDYVDDGEKLISQTVDVCWLFAELFARHDNLLLPPVPQSLYPEIVEWLKNNGEKTRETNTGKVWCYLKPELLASVPSGWTWALPSGAPARDVPKGHIAIVLSKDV